MLKLHGFIVRGVFFFGFSSFGVYGASVKLFASLVPVLLGRNLRIEVWEQEPGSSTRWRVRCAASPGNVEALLADVSIGENLKTPFEYRIFPVYTQAGTQAIAGLSFWKSIGMNMQVLCLTHVYALKTLSILSFLRHQGLRCSCLLAENLLFSCFNAVDYLSLSTLNREPNDAGSGEEEGETQPEDDVTSGMAVIFSVVANAAGGVGVAYANTAFRNLGLLEFVVSEAMCSVDASCLSGPDTL